MSGILWFLLFLHSVVGRLNLFLSTEEMKRLLGLEKELFYVRDGTVNKYALGFLIPVPSYVKQLEFTWSAPALSQNSPALYYSLTAESSEPRILPPPAVNISQSGVVPQRPQIWSLRLECSGQEAGEVVVSLNIAITGLQAAAPLNVTNLNFKRKKTCHTSPSQETEDAVLEADQTIPTYVVFFAGVGGCLFVLVLVLSLVIGTWLRTTKQRKEKVAGETNMTQYTSLSSQNNSVAARPGYMTSTLLPTTGRAEGQQADLSKDEDVVPIEKLVVDRLDLTLGDLLLEGTFGRVYQGRLGSRDVMVKTVVMGSSEAQAVKLVTEGSSLYPASHKYVLGLLATTCDGSSPMLIYEDLQPGNMKKWLSGCHQPVSTHLSVSIGLQLLTALKHLHKRQIVHRDLSARNCYLTPSLSVKLGDPALSKDLFPSDYHCLGDNENRPIKWMAIEALSGRWSPASDVWAWGVTMWEVLTRSQQPFPDVDPFEMETYLLEGFRLHQPVNCPDQLYRVMVSCWTHSAHHRASVNTLFSHLQDFNTQLQQFV